MRIDTKDLGIQTSGRLSRRRLRLPPTLIWVLSLIVIWSTSALIGSRFCCEGPFVLAKTPSMTAPNPPPVASVPSPAPSFELIVGTQSLALPLDSELKQHVGRSEVLVIKAPGFSAQAVQQLTRWQASAQALSLAPDVRFVSGSELARSWKKQADLKPLSSGFVLVGGQFSTDQSVLLTNWLYQLSLNPDAKILILDHQQTELAQVQKQLLMSQGFQADQLLVGALAHSGAPVTSVLFERINLL